MRATFPTLFLPVIIDRYDCHYAFSLYFKFLILYVFHKLKNVRRTQILLKMLYFGPSNIF